MKRSTSRILTTHTGSLPRSPELQDLLRLREDQQSFDEASFQSSIRGAVSDIIDRQQNAGIDVVNDGEQGRSQYATYVKERLSGFEGERMVRSRPRLDDADFPEYAATQTSMSSRNMPQPACTGSIAWKDWPAVERDIANLREAVADRQVEEVFMTAASPGVIANFLPNEYYATEEEYLYALAEVMKDEYNAIAAAGLILQIDCPDLAMTRVSQFSHLSVEEFKKIVELHVEVINYALKDIDPEQHAAPRLLGKHRGPPPPRCAPAGDREPGAAGPPLWACPSKAPTPGTATSGRCGRTSASPRARCCFPACWTPPPTSSNIRSSSPSAS